MAIPTILSGAAGRALRTLEPISANFDPGATQFWRWASRETINSAKPDLVKALGAARQPAFSSELHVAVQNLANGVQATASTRQIAGAMTELQSAANATTTKRVIGGLAVAGGIAGLVALARAGGGGEDGVPMAPGRPGDEPTYVSV